MRKLGQIFFPEETPIHKNTFGIATTLTLTEAELAGALTLGKGRIPAGVYLQSNTSAKTILQDVVAGVKIANKSADALKVGGLLTHDIEVIAGQLVYSAGLMVSGVVYTDIMDKVNAALTSSAVEAHLAKQGLLFYNVITKR